MTSQQLADNYHNEKTMEKFIKYTCIGLETKDTSVIKSILKLTTTLHDKFVAIEHELYGSADLLFVNADNNDSFNIWNELKSQKKTITPIMITNQKKTIDNEVTLHRPMVFKRVIEALESVVTKQLNHVNNADTITKYHKKVLIVDDSFSVRKYMEHKLPSLYSDALILDFAASGKGAMEKIKSIAYDLVFLDVVMPEVDGYKVCKSIKSVRPKTRIIMLTSKKSPFDRVRGSMSGCDAYLTKPPSDEKLKKILLG